MFNVAIENAGFSGQGCERDIKDLIAVTLAAVRVDVDGDGDDGKEKLVFNELALVEEFI